MNDNAVAEDVHNPIQYSSCDGARVTAIIGLSDWKISREFGAVRLLDTG